MLNWRRKVSSTCSASPARMSPVSTKTQVSWSPTALCTRAAATAESTPPDSAHSTRSVPDLGPHRGHLLLDDRDVGPLGRHRTRRSGSVEQLAAALGVDDLGVELHAEDAPLGVVDGGHRRTRAVVARRHEPAGAPRDGVAVAHPHLGVAGQSASSGEVPVGVSAVRPYSPAPVRDTVAPELQAMSWAP